jgi:hypothetical protein
LFNAAWTAASVGFWPRLAKSRIALPTSSFVII